MFMLITGVKGVRGPPGYPGNSEPHDNVIVCLYATIIIHVQLVGLVLGESMVTLVHMVGPEVLDHPGWLDRQD